MVNIEKAEKIIKRLDERNRLFSIQLLGNKKNKEYGFGILLKSGGFSGEANEIYHGINISVIELLREAEIEFKILELEQ